MGMKANSGLFHGTSGDMKYKLKMQFFASKIFDKSGHVSHISLEKYGQDLLNKSAVEVGEIMNAAGYKYNIKAGRKSSTLVVSTNPTKNRNITQIQLSPNGSRHHGDNPYVKVSTKDIGVIKIVDGTKET